MWICIHPHVQRKLETLGSKGSGACTDRELIVKYELTLCLTGVGRATNGVYCKERRSLKGAATTFFRGMWLTGSGA